MDNKEKIVISARSRRYYLPGDAPVRTTPCADMVDTCVPDQALSVREILERCQRENKPLPKPRDYDFDSVEREYDELAIPEHISKEDALHLLDKVSAHKARLDAKLRDIKKAEKHADEQQNASAPTSENE